MLQGRLTNDGLTPEQREIRDLVRTLARERIAPRAAEIDSSAEFPWDVVELFRENGIFGTLADEEHGGRRGERACRRSSRSRRSRRSARRAGSSSPVQELGALGFKLAGTEEQKRRFLPGHRVRRDARGLCADRARLGLRRGGDAHRGTPGRRRVRTRRVEALHHERRASPGVYVVFAKTDPAAGHDGISAFVVEGGRAGARDRPDRAEDGDQGLDHGRGVPHRVPRAGREPARRGGRGVAARDADSRPLAARYRRAGARDRRGCDRLRARVREDARDDGRADRQATSSSPGCSPTWRRAARPRAGCSTAAAR